MVCRKEHIALQATSEIFILHLFGKFAKHLCRDRLILLALNQQKVFIFQHWVGSAERKFFVDIGGVLAEIYLCS